MSISYRCVIGNNNYFGCPLVNEFAFLLCYTSISLAGFVHFICTCLWFSRRLAWPLDYHLAEVYHQIRLLLPLEEEYCGSGKGYNKQKLTVFQLL